MADWTAMRRIAVRKGLAEEGATVKANLDL